ncbi:hypothetical protein KKC45_02730 [Patescibacteria group bacterium]|nr:hypothetical protein [Patescibacteria group bacterium]
MKNKIYRFLIIITIPLILYVFWYLLEYQKLKIIEDFEFEGGYKTKEEAISILKNQEIVSKINENNYSVLLRSYLESEENEFDNFKKAVSESFLDKIGIFSKLSIHRVCLNNKNILQFDTTKSNVDNTVGAIGIKQQGKGYNFYAEIDNLDCKNVSKNNFVNSPSRAELRYTYILDMNIKENELQNNYYFRPISINTDRSSFILKLNFWRTFIPFFLIMSLIWSFLLFKILKIRDYIKTGKY